MYSLFGRYIPFSFFMPIAFEIVHTCVSVQNTNGYKMLSDNQSINAHAEVSSQQDSQLNANACGFGLSSPPHWGPDQTISGLVNNTDPVHVEAPLGLLQPAADGSKL